MQVHIIDLAFHQPNTIAAFLVEGPEGYVLVETGPHSCYERLKSSLQSYGLGPEDLSAVLLTHIHLDHAGAAWVFGQLGVPVYVHPKGYKHLADPTKLLNSARQIYGDQMEALWGELHPIPEAQLVEVADNTVYGIAGMDFKALHTPGHAKHHVAWWVQDRIFCGDVAGVRIQNGPLQPPCPPPDIDLEAWIDAIDRIREAEPNVLYITHFGAYEAVEQHLESLEEALNAWAEWVREALAQGKQAEEISQPFQDWAELQLKAAGADEALVQRYNLANPAFMSVHGLVRYWHKRQEREAGD
jgi:glyoxylase-like metal-dependent hydrolase (beta-lactamase superfamily II)